MRKLIYMNINGQDNSLTLAQGDSDSLKPDFKWILHGMGTKGWSNSPGHLTKMSAMPIYGKNIKRSSSLEPNG